MTEVYFLSLVCVQHIADEVICRYELVAWLTESRI